MTHRIHLAISSAFIALFAAACIVEGEDIGESESVDNSEQELVAASDAAAAGTCSCNPAPDSSGKWSVSSESCSRCSTSADCATAKCRYVHSVHGETEEVGCRFSSGTAVDADSAPILD